MNENTAKFSRIPLIHKCNLSPFTLFEGIPTVQEENITYIEYLMGIRTQINNLITTYNHVADFLNTIATLPDRMTALEGSMAELEDSVTNFQNSINLQILNLTNQIVSGDTNTLNQAKAYTDEKIKDIEVDGGSGYMYGALTAQEYDALQLTATDYEAYDFTALAYDTKAKWILLGSDGTVYLNFQETIEITSLATVFDLPNPPVETGKRYLFEISLGTFSLDSNEAANLEIVGQNTLGNTLPIRVPSGGSATVCGVFIEKPTSIRAMSDQSDITAHNAYIKIKPLGELV